MTCIGVTLLLMALPREIPSKSGFHFMGLPCFHFVGLSRNRSMKALLQLLAKHPPLMLASCKYLLVNCCSLLSLTKGANSTRIWRRNKAKWVCPISLAHSTAGLSGKAMLLHGSGVIVCVCFKLWLKYLAETCRIQD